MRVAIIQSSYVPWRGYFDFIDSVDTFVIYDDVQYSKGSWRNRNQLKGPAGRQWITVPVRRRELAQRICDTEIDYTRDWRGDHRGTLTCNYARAPYLDDALALLDAAFATRHHTISELNIALLNTVCMYLDIRTPLRHSSEFMLHGRSTDRVIDLLEAVGATTYVSGPAARAYLDEAAFRAAGIRLEYKDYTYAPYPQLWGPFEGAVSILDLIANCGTRSRAHLHSLGVNQAAA